MLGQRLSSWVALIVCLLGADLRVDSVKITLDDILTSKYSARGWSGTWVAGDLVQLNSGGNVIRYNPVDQTNTTYFDGSAFSDNTLYPGRSFSFSADEQVVLVTHSVKPLWRHSFTAKYHVRSRTNPNGPIVELKPNGSTEHVELQLVKWSTRASNLIYVYNGNIYYREAATTANSDVQLTTSGNGDTITNGHTDWVYEEEMFGDNLAAWFSPTGSRLAYIEFDDSAVEDFSYPMYGEPEGRNETNSYPKWTHIKYPRPGTTNPLAKLWVINLPTANTRRELQYPAGTPAGLLHYIAAVKWLSETHLLIVHLDRPQQNANWFRCDVTPTGPATCQNVFTISEPTGWVDVYPPVVSANGGQFLTTRINDGSTTTKDYKHIVLVNATGSVVPRRITTEEISVDSILKWDETNGVIYFTATGLAANNDPEPSHTHVYQISYNSGTNPMAKCITCALNTDKNEKCLQNSMSFSLSLNNVIHSCGGPVIPETVIRSRNSDQWNIIRVMASNDELRTALANVEVPQSRDFVIPSGTGLPIRARLFLPKNFDEGKKYPLFIDVYGGPGSQNIRQSFSINWGSSLVSSHDIIYGFIDGRGSARQTGAHLFQMRDRMGTVEIEDQIAAVKTLVAENAYIDSTKTAIWGWSYGGYATSMVMAKDTEKVFKCGISVAPVTSWLFYDTIYTERYMGEPNDNRVGYEGGDVTRPDRMDGFKNHQFFLVHGNADDNVHYQQSMVLARALEKADVVFEQLSYPDEAHSINGPGMRRHLYHSLEKFLFRDCFPHDQTTPSSAPQLYAVSAVTLALGLLSIALANVFRF